MNKPLKRPELAAYVAERLARMKLLADKVPNIDQWVDFLDGEWTRERPTAPGFYPVAAMGEVAAHGASRAPHLGTRIVTLIADAESRHTRCVPEWGAWFWSKALPSLPALPAGG